MFILRFIWLIHLRINTLSPGQILKYKVDGTLSMERKLNTLIPDEDQQIQWD